MSSELGGRIAQIPEFSTEQSIRIAPNTAVPVTKRLLRIIDSEPFQRLRKIRQLSLSDRVFPSATHTRFAHALGVYKNVLDYLRRLDTFPHFSSRYTSDDYLAVMLAGLLHDLGHYPCSHQLDHIPPFPKHEELTIGLIKGELTVEDGNLNRLIRDEFGIDPESVARFLRPARELDPRHLQLKQVIDSPLDADKCDYLPRDSYFCGVDYSFGFDKERFIANLVPSRETPMLGIHEKGLTSAERFQLARYWMYRSVYWGHTVRAFITMLSKATEYLKPVEDGCGLHRRLLDFNDTSFLDWLHSMLEEPGRELLEMLHHHRRPYKRVFTVSLQRDPEWYVALRNEGVQNRIRLDLTDWCRRRGLEVPEHHLIWDVPPAYKDRKWETFPIVAAGGYEYSCDEESPVIEALGKAFLQGVRQIRLFCHPKTMADIQALKDPYPGLRELMA